MECFLSAPGDSLNVSPASEIVHHRLGSPSAGRSMFSARILRTMFVIFNSVICWETSQYGAAINGKLSRIHRERFTIVVTSARIYLSFDGRLGVFGVLYGSTTADAAC